MHTVVHYSLTAIINLDYPLYRFVTIIEDVTFFPILSFFYGGSSNIIGVESSCVIIILAPLINQRQYISPRSRWQWIDGLDT